MTGLASVRRVGISFIIIVCAFVLSTLSTCRGREAPVTQQAAGYRGQVAGRTEESTAPRETTLSESLAELDALPAPEGVDESLFSRLKEALRGALPETVGARHAVPLREKDTAKITSTPPFGEDNVIQDLSLIGGGTSYHLAWSYKNIGDYNQDSMVNIADLTPLAIHFNEFEDAGAGWPHPICPAIDGNGDTSINISDITPLAIHFFSGVAGYAILGSDSSEGEFTKVADVPFAPPEPEELLRFTAPVPASGHKFFAVAPYDGDGNLGDMSNIVHFDFPPVARMTADPPAGDAPLTVSFFAGESYDPDGGSIVNYRWDLDGDGIYEYDSGDVPSASTDYADPGSYQARVLVTDDDGDTDTASLTLSVGIAEWVHTWGTTSHDEIRSVAIDGDRNVYLAGFKDYINHPDEATFLIFKYDDLGSLVWMRAWGPYTTSGDGISVDDYSNVYVTGGTVGGAMLLKYDADGGLAWARSWGGDYGDMGHALAIDDGGSIYIVGSTSSFGAGDSVGGHHMRDALVVKFGSEGNFLWARTWGGYDENEVARAVAVDSEQNVNVAGETSLSDIEQYRDVMLLKYDPDGNVLWSKVWGGEGEADWAAGLAIDEEDNLYLTGGTTSFGRVRDDVLLLKVDSDGNVLWVRTWGGPAGDQGNQVSVDDEGGVYVVGRSNNLGPGQWDAVVLKYDAWGNLIWEKLWGTTEWDRGFAIAVDEGGTLYIGGYAPNAYGEWQDVWAESIPPELPMRDVEGVITEPDAEVAVPSQETTVPEGVEDEGGGGEDALIIKLSPP